MRIALAVVLAVGCGDDNSTPPDAMPPDDPVAIRVTRQSVPLEGIPIVFQRADGTVVASTATDADGRAEDKVGEGGFVTAVTDFAATVDVKTFAGLSPGDQLVIDGAPNLATPMTSYLVRVNAVAGAVFYRVCVRCLVGTGENVSPGGNPIDLPVTTTCLAPTEVVVVALDNFGFPLESVGATDITPTNGGVVDLTGAIGVAAEVATVTMTNVPANTLLEPTRSLGTAVFLAETEPATNAARPVVFPDIGGDDRQTIALTGTTRPVFAWGEPMSTTIDVSMLQVPPIDSPAVDREGGIVSWMGASSPANFAFGQLLVRGDSNYLWSYATPIEAGATEVRLPVLPAELALPPLATATSIDIELAVGRVDARDELRVDGAWLDANGGVTLRTRSLLRSPSTPGTAGFSFAGGTLTF